MNFFGQKKAFTVQYRYPFFFGVCVWPCWRVNPCSPDSPDTITTARLESPISSSLRSLCLPFSVSIYPIYLSIYPSICISTYVSICLLFLLTACLPLANTNFSPFQSQFYLRVPDGRTDLMNDGRGRS